MQDPTTNLARQALSAAQQLAQQAHHPELTPTHLAASLLASPEGVTAGVLAKLGIETQALLAEVRSALERLPRSQGGELGMSRARAETLTEAQQAARALKDEFVSTEHLLLGLARAGGPEVSGLLAARGLTAERLEAAVTEVRGGRRVTTPDPEATFDALGKYARDLTQDARDGKLDPVIGRGDEIRRAVQVLSRQIGRAHV